MIELPWYPFEWDVNRDGFFTISDVLLWLQQMFFLPGDWAIWVCLQYLPDTSRFLELDVSAYGSTIAALISLVVWIIVIVFVMTMTHYLAAVDRAFTRRVRTLVTNSAIRTRIIKRLVIEWLQRRADRGTGHQSVIDDLNLTPEELRILSAHAHVAPPGTLALSDLVRATGVPRLQATRILVRLQELELIASADDVEPDAAGYALTEPGHEIVTFVKLSVSANNG